MGTTPYVSETSQGSLETRSNNNAWRNQAISKEESLPVLEVDPDGSGYYRGGGVSQRTRVSRTSFCSVLHVFSHERARGNPRKLSCVLWLRENVVYIVVAYRTSKLCPGGCFGNIVDAAGACATVLATGTIAGVASLCPLSRNGASLTFDRDCCATVNLCREDYYGNV